MSSEAKYFRFLLASLREGDYAHAGEEEAIDMVLKQGLSIDPLLSTKATLDVGSGLGGTANYLYQKGFNAIQGIDYDQEAVDCAAQHYPHIPFICANIVDIDKVYPSSTFSFLYLFNVIYAIQEKRSVLKKLSAITKPGGLLVLFDYSLMGIGTSSTLMDLSNNPMYPLHTDQIEKDLKEAGWEILEKIDLTQKYVVWYQVLLDKLAQKSPQLAKEYSKKDISMVKETFTFLLKQLEKGSMGGALIYARKQVNIAF